MEIENELSLESYNIAKEIIFQIN